MSVDAIAHAINCCLILMQFGMNALSLNWACKRTRFGNTGWYGALHLNQQNRGFLQWWCFSYLFTL